MRRVPVALALAWFLAAPAAAKEPDTGGKVKTLLGEAEQARKREDWEKAARKVAEAGVAAQKEKSLELEEQVAVALEELLDAVRELPAQADTDAPAGPREVLAIVMRALEPVRHGAFLSAHALAGELTLRAVEQGDARHLDTAASVLTAFAASPKSGKGAAAMAKLAQGVKAARAGDAGAAKTALAATLPLVRQGRWLRPTLATHLELALVEVGSGDLAAAASTLQDAVGCLVPKDDPALGRSWVVAARARLATAPEEVRHAFEGAVKPHMGGVSAGAAGGRGGHGASAGVNVSPLGRAWPKLGATKPFATVRRGDEGYVIRGAWDANFGATQPYEPGQKTWDRDGLTLLFVDGGVALRIVDLTGLRGQPGERSHASAAWGWYLLATGETYGVTKAGLVAVN